MFLKILMCVCVDIAYLVSIMTDPKTSLGMLRPQLDRVLPLPFTCVKPTLPPSTFSEISLYFVSSSPSWSVLTPWNTFFLGSFVCFLLPSLFFFLSPFCSFFVFLTVYFFFSLLVNVCGFKPILS